MSAGPGYEANLERGWMLFQGGRYQECSEYAQKAVAIDPQRGDAYYLFSHVYSRLSGKNNEALKAVEKAISMAPQESEYQAWRAFILGILGRKKQAVQAATDALALNPHEILAFLARSQAYLRLRRRDEAEHDARRALEIDPHNIAAQGLLAQILRVDDRMIESDAITKALLAQAPHDSFGLTNAGWIAIEAGNLKMAAEYVRSALASDPNDEFARSTWFEILRRRHFLYRWEEAWKRQVMNFFGDAEWDDSPLRWAFRIPWLNLFLIVITLLVFTSVLFFWALARSLVDYVACLDPITRFSLNQREWVFALVKGLLVVPVLIYLLLTQQWIWSSMGVVLIILLLLGVGRGIAFCWKLVAHGFESIARRFD